MNGLLLVDKPGMPRLGGGVRVQISAGDADPASITSGRSLFPTSHDVVQIVRRLSGQRRIGHTGTLDPMASGLMVLCLGWTTRLVEYYQGHDKRYRAEVALGYETDTLDALGKIVDTALVPSLTIADIGATLGQFRGETLQTPPVYSALKRGGESLHYKVRRGEAVEIEPRLVTIHALELLAFRSPDRIEVDVRCSAGTYIRSLARDIGLALDTRATLIGLRRLEAGAFTVEDAHTLVALETAAASGDLASLLLSPGAGLDLPTVTVDSTTAQRLGQGQAVTLADVPPIPTHLQAHSAGGALLGILQPLALEESRWKADKWFANQE